jgi:diguanylate cyclase (GGDEF)-like protein
VIRSLGTRFAVSFALLAAALLSLTLLVIAAVSHHQAASLRDQLRHTLAGARHIEEHRALKQSTRYLSNRLFNPLYRLDISVLNEEIQQIAGWLPVDSFLILDAGRAVVTDGTDSNTRYGTRYPLDPLPQADQPTFEQTPSGTRLAFVIGFSDQVAGYALVSLSNEAFEASVAQLDARLDAIWDSFGHSLWVTGTGSLVVLAIVTFLFSGWLSRVLSRPVFEMVDAASQFAAGNLDHKLRIRSQDELGVLAHSLNRMAGDLKKNSALLARSQEMALLGSWEFQPGRDNAFVLSDGACRLLGVDRRSTPTLRSLLRLVTPADRAHALGLLRGPRGRALRAEFGVRWPDGERRVIHLQGEPLSGAQGAFIGTVQDVTERRRHEEQLARLANYDSLTGLPNRNLLRDRLERAVANAVAGGREVALLFLDLDRFKAVNDALGHAVGDDLLRSVADRLRALSGTTDTVARLGGDEFTILIEATSAEAAAERAAHTVAALAEPYRLAERVLYVSASVGVTLFPRDGHDIGTLLRNADSAMYLAKEQGRATYRFFTPELDRKVHDRLSLEQNLRDTLERRAFELHFQPQVELGTGRILGVESLLRWPVANGLVPAADFVPVLEETGMIVELTDWALDVACRQGRQWRDMGMRDLRVAVNLSAHQFQQRDVVATISRALTEHGLPPDGLEIEITESTLLDAERSLKVAEALQQLGVRLALDDFGTGYSSLSYLRRYSVDTLKIDRSFVVDVEADHDSALITAAVIALSMRLGLDTVAEGVETPAQLAQLRKLGCDAIQGYLVSPPMTAAAFTTWAGQQIWSTAGCYWRGHEGLMPGSLVRRGSG